MAGKLVAKTSQSEQIIIIGGGLIGTATLYELSRRGIAAVLLEMGDDLALETSFANGGMMTPSQSEPWNGPGVAGHLFSSLFLPGAAMKLHWLQIPSLTNWGLQFLRNSWADKYLKAVRSNFTLAAYSAAKTADILQQYQPDIDQSSNGSLKVFNSKKAFAKSLAMADFLGKFSMQSQKLNAAGAVAIEPQLQASRSWIKGAIYYPDDSAADARKFALFLADLAVKSGGEVKKGVTAKHLISDKGKIIGAQTTQGEFYGKVVICAGDHSPKLVAPVGLKLSIKPVKGYSVTLSAKHIKTLMPRLAVIDEAKHIAVVPLGDNIRIAGTAEFAGFDHSLPMKRSQSLQKMCHRLYPELASGLDWQIAENWAGLRPMSADGVPFIGATPLDGLWLNCGHGHLGWTMAIGSANLLGDMLIGNKPDIDPLSYRYGR